MDKVIRFRGVCNVGWEYIPASSAWVEDGRFWPSERISNDAHDFLRDNFDQDDWIIDSKERDIYGIIFRNAEDAMAFKIAFS